MTRSSFEHPMMPREIADAPDIMNVPVADGVHTLSGTVVEMYHELRRISDHLGITLDRDLFDTTELGDRVRDLKGAVHTEESIETLALEVDGTVRYALHASEAARNTAIRVYPVGMMAILLSLRAAVTQRRPRYFVWRWHLRNLVHGARKRWFWNGFLADIDYPPAGLTHTRCGSGWTRRRAARNLGLQLWKDNQR